MSKRPLRFAIVSREKARVAAFLKKRGLCVVSSRPDFVVAFGGDGTILLSEQQYPGVVKLGVRNSKRCNTCAVRFKGRHKTELMCWSCLEKGIESILAGDYDVVLHPKLEATAAGKKLTALNEIQIHNADPRTAIRLDVAVGGKIVSRDVLGDGLLVATPFGATGYFHTLARQVFSKGFGLAFNNPVDVQKPVFFDRPDVRVFVQRGPAWLLADNDARKVILSSGQKVVFRQSRTDARFAVLR